MKKARYLRIYAVILLISVLFTSNNFISAETLPVVSIDGKVVCDIEKSGQEKNYTYQDAKMDITRGCLLDGQTINLDTIVKYKSSQFNVQITGNWNRSFQNSTSLIGNVQDSSGNFKVVYFGLEDIKSSNDLIIKNSNFVNQKILKIYLLKESERDFLTFEVPINQVNKLINYENTTNLTKVQSSLPVIEDVTKEHWWVNVFEPEVTSEAITSTSVHTGYDTVTFKYSDGPGGNTYRYEIDVKAWANVYDFGSASKITDNFGLEVTGNRYYFNNTLQSSQLLQINKCRCSYVLSGSNNRDSITAIDFGHKNTTYTSGGLGVDASISLAYGVISATITWEEAGLIFDYTPPFTYDVNKNVKGIEFPYEARLNRKGSSYYLQAEKTKNSKSSGKKASGAVFEFDISFLNKSNSLGSKLLVASAAYT